MQHRCGPAESIAQRLRGSRSGLVLRLGLAALLFASQHAFAQEKVNLADLLEKVEPAVLRLDVTGKEGKSIGSGFVIDAAGIAITNVHVVANAQKATAKFEDGRSFDVEGVLGFDASRDIAVIKLRLAQKLPTLKLQEKAPRKGEPVVAVGSPQGLSFTATEGIISAIRPGAELLALGKPEAAGTWLQSSAPISPGNSGGPLLNLQGEVVGMNTLQLRSGQNLNFAIAAADIADVVAKFADKPVAKLSTVQPSKESKAPTVAAGDAIVVKLPAERRFAHKTKILVEEDKFAKITVIRTEWLNVSQSDKRFASFQLEVSFPKVEKGVTPAVIWRVGTVSDRPIFAREKDRELLVLIDKEPYTLGSAKYEAGLIKGKFAEFMTNVVRLDAFLKLLSADTLEARIAGSEFTLNRQQVECLRDLASRVNEGATTDGAMVVERYALDDDPSNPKRPKAAKTTGEGEEKTEKTADPQDEKKAAAKLRLAKQLLEKDKKANAKKYLDELVEQFPDSEAAKEAQELLKKVQ